MGIKEILKPKTPEDFINSIKNQHSFLKHVDTLLKNNNRDFILQILNNPNFDPSWSDNYIFIECCRYDYVTYVKSLMNHPNIDPSYQNNRALRIAYHHDSYGSISELIDEPRVRAKIDQFQYDSLLSILKGFNLR